MPVLNGSLMDITKSPMPTALRPRLFFRLEREARRGNSLFTTHRVEAPLNGSSFEVELEATEGMKFTNGRPAEYVAEVEWRDAVDQWRHTDRFEGVQVSLAGGAIGDQAGEIVPAGSDIAIGLTQPDWPGTYYWLQATHGDPDVEATGSGNVYKVVG